MCFECQYHFIKGDQQPNNQNDQNWCLLVVLVYNLKREEAAWLLLFSNYKPKQPVNTSFGQLDFWFLVTIDEMKQAKMKKKCISWNIFFQKNLKNRQLQTIFFQFERIHNFLDTLTQGHQFTTESRHTARSNTKRFRLSRRRS